MEGYLGEKIIDVSNTEYVEYTPLDWALLWIKIYGGIDGAHHKDWLLDHVVRILKGTQIIIKEIKWSNGFIEKRFTLDEPTEEYLQWVKEIKSGEDGEDTYDYEYGCAP